MMPPPLGASPSRRRVLSAGQRKQPSAFRNSVTDEMRVGARLPPCCGVIPLYFPRLSKLCTSKRSTIVRAANDPRKSRNPLLDGRSRILTAKAVRNDNVFWLKNCGIHCTQIEG